MSDDQSEGLNFEGLDTTAAPGLTGLSVSPTSYSSPAAKLPAAAKRGQGNPVYSVLLLISLAAIAAGTVLLVLEWGRYDYQTTSNP